MDFYTSNNSSNQSFIPGFSHALLLILVYVIAAIIVSPLIILGKKVSPIFEQWGMLINYVLPFAMVLIVAKKWWQVPNFDTQKVNLIVYMLSVPLTIATAIMLEGIVSLLPMPELFKQIFEQMIQLNYVGYLTIGIAAPIFEELIFRGIILKKFLEKYKPGKAIIYSALIFGIGHFNPWQFIPAFTVGLIIGYLYWQTQSIWPGIFIHFINNSFSFYLAKTYNDVDITFYKIIDNPLYYFSLLILCMLICYSIYKVLKNYFNPPLLKNAK